MSDRIVESCKANATEPVLEVHRLAHTYGDVDALRGVDLEVHAGEVVGLLGPNGAGKTTLVRIVATLIEPDDGHVSWCAGRTPPRRQRRFGLISGSLVSSRRWTSCSPVARTWC